MLLGLLCWCHPPTVLSPLKLPPQCGASSLCSHPSPVLQLERACWPSGCAATVNFGKAAGWCPHSLSTKHQCHPPSPITVPAWSQAWSRRTHRSGLTGGRHRARTPLRRIHRAGLSFLALRQHRLLHSSCLAHWALRGWGHRTWVMQAARKPIQGPGLAMPTTHLLPGQTLPEDGFVLAEPGLLGTGASAAATPAFHVVGARVPIGLWVSTWSQDKAHLVALASPGCSSPWPKAGSSGRMSGACRRSVGSSFW